MIFIFDGFFREFRAGSKLRGLRVNGQRPIGAIITDHEFRRCDDKQYYINTILRPCIGGVSPSIVITSSGGYHRAVDMIGHDEWL